MTEGQQSLSDREIVALHILLTTGQRVDETSLQHITALLDTELTAMRKRIGTVRFGALLKNAWRRDGGGEHSGEERPGAGS
ncbi:MAG: hypothetical protein M1296_00625 [Chloroflexi bacterium]|nr:hypothetical protein [Chloroflexota bacterium]